jgi:hypothetical protein
MKCIGLLLSSCLFMAGSGWAQTGLQKNAITRGQGDSQEKAFPQKMDLEDELRSLYDISHLPLYRDLTVEAQVSTYDTTGGNDDGFNGRYSYIRRNRDSSLVIFDVKGSGVINRIWTPTPTDDTLDFLIDDSSRPALSIRYCDLFSHKVFPFVAPLTGSALGGYYCYFPILFQHHCEIICRGKKLQFHQIQYRLYPAGTLVTHFTRSLSRGEIAALHRTTALWNKDSLRVEDLQASGPVDSPSRILSKTVRVELRPGEAKTVWTLEERGRILGIELDPASLFAGANKNVDIRISWDRETNPAVYCPVADLFGYAFGEPAMRSLLLGTRANKNYCYFPMPFDQGAGIGFVYRRADVKSPPIAFRMKIYYTKTGRDSLREGKFYACWRDNRLSSEDPYHVLLQAAGKGHYAGTILQAQGVRTGMTYFFEGDDSTATDGFPRIHGTGSEDYFNGGWYAFPDRWDGRHSLPIHGCLDYSLPFCRTGGYRFYLSDKIPFEKNIFQCIEHGPDAKGIPADYTSVSFYYCNAGVAAYQTPSSEICKVSIPDTLLFYPQLLQYNIWGNIRIKSSWAYPTGGLSFQFTADDASRLKMVLPRIPAGTYKLYADLVEYAGGCAISVWQEQTQLSPWIDTNKPATGRKENLYICETNMGDSLNSLTIAFKTVTGGNTLFLNRLMLVKQQEE